ncbi:proline iminopeptidase [Parafrankia irregularis]|uniref:Proline iminopeptidase n=1 Tax=Parafrankia irregularis TaxID=795642 RepID=A0A0S4QVN5_9ACTN|nr:MULTISPECIES: alpha/beta hydrolase [Parafrankia]MBE3205806.1 alpha/beta hydrolase [Parafrankia sp. CH37]CUU59680.1 proline iminopeptidase [Parafrankia irregularis]
MTAARAKRPPEAAPRQDPGSARAFRVARAGGHVAGSVRGGGTPLLVLHGGPGLSDTSFLFADELEGWQTVRYTQRGVPPSSEQGPYTLEHHVADAVAVIDALGLQHVCVVGHSWGGHLAMHLAVSRPDRVLGLVLVDPFGATGDGGEAALATEMTARLPAGDAARADALDRRALAGFGSEAEALESMALFWRSYYANPAHAPAMPAGLRLSVSCYAESLTSMRHHLAQDTLARLAPTATCPVHVVVGGASPIPTSVGSATADLFPRGRLITVPGGGHLPWTERPGCLRAALENLRNELHADSLVPPHARQQCERAEPAV